MNKHDINYLKLKIILNDLISQFDYGFIGRL